MTALALNDRFVTVPAPARAMALDVKTVADRIALDIGGSFATPHGKADAFRQIQTLRHLLVELAFELDSQ